jgi:hypothetical protein
MNNGASRRFANDKAGHLPVHATRARYRHSGVRPALPGSAHAIGLPVAKVPLTVY